MMYSDFFGPFELTQEKLDSTINYLYAGVYVLGESNGVAFSHCYVGRSDACLRTRLKDHIGNYTHFKFLYCESPVEAYLLESELYHELKPKDNDNHPACLESSDVTCLHSDCEVYNVD